MVPSGPRAPPNQPKSIGRKKTRARMRSKRIEALVPKKFSNIEK
jgi:hypothetical protein